MLFKKTFIYNTSHEGRKWNLITSMLGFLPKKITALIHSEHQHCKMNKCFLHLICRSIRNQDQKWSEAMNAILINHEFMMNSKISGIIF